MNSRILLLLIYIVALSSCSVYKSGQTPDDVYYSPSPAARQQKQQQNNDDEYLNVNQQKAGAYQSYDQYQDGVRDDRFLRMSVDNPYYMSAYNSYGAFDWRYNSYYDGFSYGFGSPWNNYFAWNSFYNPYCYYGYNGIGFGYGYAYYGGGFYGGGVIKTSYSSPVLSRPLVFNVGSYINTNRPLSRNYVNGNYNNYNQRYNNGSNTYYNNGRSSNPSSGSNNNSYTPSRSYSPSSGGGGGSSSSSGGGGGGGISRPGRH